MKRLIISILLLVAFFATTAEAATLTTTIARVREYLYEPSAANSIYTDTQITEAINEAQCLLEDLLSASANFENISKKQFAVMTGETSISLANLMAQKFKGILNASILLNGVYKPMIQVRPEEFAPRFYNGTTKDPVFCFIDGALNFFPAALSSTTVEISYTKYYAPLVSGSDTLEVQMRFERVLLYAACYIVLAADHQKARADNFYKLLIDLITIKNQKAANGIIPERVQGGVK